MVPGNWREDFYTVAPLGEDFSQVVHVFVGDSGLAEKVEPVGLPVDNATMARAIGLPN